MLTIMEQLDSENREQGQEIQRELDQEVSFACFDIETAPLDDDTLRKFCPPCDVPAHPGEFDPAAVKYGNTKDPAKRAEKLKEEQEKHARAVKDHDTNVAQAQTDWFAKFKDRAALDATTGRVVAIGVTINSSSTIIDCEHEDEGIGLFWRWVEGRMLTQMPMVGWNTHGFDLPFLIRRSWILGVPIPLGVRKGRYWNDLFVDLMQHWMLGSRDMVKLDVAAKAFGIDGKVEQVDGVAVSGATFYQLWRENRNVAEAYLMADLRIPAELAVRMGVV